MSKKLFLFLVYIGMKPIDLVAGKLENLDDGQIGNQDVIRQNVRKKWSNQEKFAINKKYLEDWLQRQAFSGGETLLMVPETREIIQNLYVPLSLEYELALSENAMKLKCPLSGIPQQANSASSKQILTTIPEIIRGYIPVKSFLNMPKRLSYDTTLSTVDNVLSGCKIGDQIFMARRRPVFGGLENEAKILNNLQAPQNVLSLEQIVDFLEDFIKKDPKIMNILRLRPVSLIPAEETGAQNCRRSEIFKRLILALQHPAMKDLKSHPNVHQNFQFIKKDNDVLQLFLNGSLVNTHPGRYFLKPNFYRNVEAAEKNFPQKENWMQTVVKYLPE